jgi:hypothetical protein
VDGLPKDKLESFKSSYASTAFQCRYPFCPNRTAGFASAQLRGQHEATHVRRIYCQVSTCQWSRIGFKNKSGLDNHVRTDHSEVTKILVPSKVRSERYGLDNRQQSQLNGMGYDHLRYPAPHLTNPWASASGISQQQLYPTSIAPNASTGLETQDNQMLHQSAAPAQQPQAYSNYAPPVSQPQPPVHVPYSDPYTSSRRDPFLPTPPQQRRRGSYGLQSGDGGGMNTVNMPGNQFNWFAQISPRNHDIAKGMNNIQGSSMNQQGLDNHQEMFTGNTPPGQPQGNHDLQDYQLQLMMLEQQKKRLLMAQQEQGDTSGPHAQGAVGGPAGFPPSMPPQGSRAIPLPSHTDQIKRGTPKMNQ